MVSKSIAPPAMPASPQQIILSDWSQLPANAEMVAFGSLAVNGGRVAVSGWLFDAKNGQSPQVLGKQYNEAATEDNARLIAHRFADEIILRLGGGINGIAETHIFYISSKTGTKEIWQMDYDGQGAQQVTHLGTHLALAARLAGQLPHRVHLARQWRLEHSHVLAGAEPHRGLPIARRHHPVSRLGGRRH